MTARNVVIQGTEMPRFDGTPYVYPATPEERERARFLKERGWHVSAPSCPICHGAGSINTSYSSSGKGTPKDPIVTTVTADPCPNGCPTPKYFL